MKTKMPQTIPPFVILWYYSPYPYNIALKHFQSWHKTLIWKSKKMEEKKKKKLPHPRYYAPTNIKLSKDWSVIRRPPISPHLSPMQASKKNRKNKIRNPEINPTQKNPKRIRPKKPHRSTQTLEP